MYVGNLCSSIGNVSCVGLSGRYFILYLWEIHFITYSGCINLFFLIQWTCLRLLSSGGSYTSGIKWYQIWYESVNMITFSES